MGGGGPQVTWALRASPVTNLRGMSCPRGDIPHLKPASATRHPRQPCPADPELGVKQESLGDPGEVPVPGTLSRFSHPHSDLSPEAAASEMGAQGRGYPIPIALAALLPSGGPGKLPEPLRLKPDLPLKTVLHLMHRDPLPHAHPRLASWEAPQVLAPPAPHGAQITVRSVPLGCAPRAAHLGRGVRCWRSRAHPRASPQGTASCPKSSPTWPCLPGGIAPQISPYHLPETPSCVPPTLPGITWGHPRPCV